MKFKVASRTPDELEAHKQELNGIFDVVKGSRNRIDPKGIKYLEENRWEVAELIVQLINDQVLVTDPTPYLVDTTEGELGNEYIWQELDATLRVVQRSYGTKPLTQRLWFKEWGITTSSKEINVAIPLEEIAVGRITAAQVTEEMAAAINRDRISTILSGVDAGVPSVADRTGDPGYALRYTGFTETNLQRAVDGLLDESESPTIFARHIAIAPTVRGFTGYSNESLREFELRGAIGTFNGATIVTLRDQYNRREAAHMVSKDKIYVASGTKGAIWMSKDVSFLNYSLVEPRTSTFETGLRLEDGLLVHDAYQYRILDRT